MLLPECAASMTGVPVPSIRICVCPAGLVGAGDAWADSIGAEPDARMQATAIKVKARDRDERPNSERFMLTREWGRQTYREPESTARTNGESPSGSQHDSSSSMASLCKTLSLSDLDWKLPRGDEMQPIVTRDGPALKQFLDEIDANPNFYSQAGHGRDLGSGAGFLQQ